MFDLGERSVVDRKGIVDLLFGFAVELVGLRHSKFYIYLKWFKGDTTVDRIYTVSIQHNHQKYRETTARPLDRQETLVVFEKGRMFLKIKSTVRYLQLTKVAINLKSDANAEEKSETVRNRV